MKPGTQPHRTGADHRTRGRRRCGVVALAALTAATALAPASPAAAAPESTRAAPARVPAAVPADPSQKELKKLEKQAKSLAKQYRGKIGALDDARRAAKKASRQSTKLNRDLRAAVGKVRRLAVLSYTSNGPMSGSFSGDNPLPMLVGGAPNKLMGDIAVLQHLARGNGQRVHELSTMADRAKSAKRTADTKIGNARKLVTRLKKRRSKVQELLAKYKPQTPTSRPDGAPHGKSPITGDQVTPRMRHVRTVIDQRFGPFPTIGCFRAGDQDHGTGTACDFMESTGGNMPSAAAQAHGDKVAQYAIDHASELGVKYIIWRQRIWDIRAGGGWDPMEDRGSITANHFDHVHISVL